MNDKIDVVPAKAQKVSLSNPCERRARPSVADTVESFPRLDKQWLVLFIRETPDQFFVGIEELDLFHLVLGKGANDDSKVLNQPGQFERSLPTHGFRGHS